MVPTLKTCCCTSNQRSQCGLYRKTICLFVTAAFALSMLSALDCKFIKVDVGFIPDESVYNISTFGIGLWSLQDPENHNDDESGKCLLPWRSKQYGNLAGGGHSSYYGQMFVWGDLFWTVSQITAFSGMIVGLGNTLLSWKLAFSPEDSKSLYLVTILSIICFTMEGFKLGFFFDIQLCTSHDIWQKTDANITVSYQAEQCFFHRGGFLSLSCMICIIISLVFLLVNLSYSTRNKNLNETQLPSFGTQNDNESTNHITEAPQSLTKNVQESAPIIIPVSSKPGDVRKFRSEPNIMVGSIPSDIVITPMSSSEHRYKSRRDMRKFRSEPTINHSFRENLKRTNSNRSNPIIKYEFVNKNNAYL